MSNDKYILEGHEPKAVSVMEWASWFETNTDRHIAKTSIDVPRWKFWLGKLLRVKKWQPVLVSTVFLGLDHSFGEGPPLLFETMVFGGLLDQEMNRYFTWDEAEKGHREMVQKVKEPTSTRTQS